MKKKRKGQPVRLLNEKIDPKILEELARPNIKKSIESIKASKDRRWLLGFRQRMAAKNENQIVTAIDERFAELDELEFRQRISKPSTASTLAERVWETVLIYEEFLARKHDGRRIKASRTRQMIKDWGEKEAARRTVANMDTSAGLEMLARYDRLDCSYEQIILDFPSEFDPGLRRKAVANLTGVSAYSPRK